MTRTPESSKLSRLERRLIASVFICCALSIIAAVFGKVPVAADCWTAGFVLFMCQLAVRKTLSDLPDTTETQRERRPRLWASSIRAGLTEAGVPMQTQLTPEEEKLLVEELHFTEFG